MHKRMGDTTLRDILAEFVGKPPGEVGVVIIHLHRAVEREASILEMERVLGGHPIEVFDAIEGGAMIRAGHPVQYASVPAETRTVGEVGCLVSHIEVARRALREEKSHMMIFEDDCIPGSEFSLEGIRTYLRQVREFSDTFSFEGASEFLLFGTCGCYTWKHLTNDIKATDRFNGSHCYFIGRPMMEKLIGVYEYLLGREKIVPFDELLGLLLRSHGRWALCPTNEIGFFVQNRAIPSYLLGDEVSMRSE